MHLAILMTNTDDSDFAHRWPLDGEKFQTFIADLRPDWRFTVYAVKDGVFPDSLDSIDGVMITGSPHSVNAPDAWVARLLDLIRDIHARNLPMFGACFGHQAIAMALGGRVDNSPHGWSYGAVDTTLTTRPDWLQGGPDTVTLYAANSEQVTDLPANARIVMQSPDCPVAGFTIGQTVFTTQYHPEITPAFMAALIDEFEDQMGADISDKARATLTRSTHSDVFATWVVQFFEAPRDAPSSG